jgi:hypothetical protein
MRLPLCLNDDRAPLGVGLLISTPPRITQQFGEVGLADWAPSVIACGLVSPSSLRSADCSGGASRDLRREEQVIQSLLS